jgi:hypothetical protein
VAAARRLRYSWAGSISGASTPRCDHGKTGSRPQSEQRSRSVGWEHQPQEITYEVLRKIATPSAVFSMSAPPEEAAVSNAVAVVDLANTVVFAEIPVRTPAAAL